MCVDGLTKQTEQAEGKDMVLLIDGCPHMAFFYRWLTIFYMLLLAICEHLSLAYSLSLSHVQLGKDDDESGLHYMNTHLQRADALS
jgi:hypothetical protein